MDIENFKPLSSGLGFHKQEETSFQKDFEKIKPLEKELGTYLPQTPQTKKSHLDMKFPTAPTETPPEVTKKEALSSPALDAESDSMVNSFCLQSFLMDTVFVSMLFFSFILATAIGFGREALHAIFQQATLFPFLLSFMVLFQAYVLFSRCYFGKTLGESQRSLHLGTQKQQNSPWFFFLVLWRSALNISTGLIVFPILSFIFQKELLGTFSTLHLYKEPDSLERHS